jgi:hypothetical protein
MIALAEVALVEQKSEDKRTCRLKTAKSSVVPKPGPSVLLEAVGPQLENLSANQINRFVSHSQGKK